MFCKPWYDVWLASPILDFLTSRSKKGQELMKNTLKRYQEHKLCIDQLKLLLLINESSPASFVDECIDIVAQIDIKRLKLVFDIKPRYLPYTLPRKTFEVLNKLTDLIVHGSNSRLKKEIGEKIMFSHLHKLVLSYVYIDDDMFQDIVKGSPLIDSLCVCGCGGLKIIKVTNNNNLKKLHIWADGDQSIEIDAPYLVELCCAMDSGTLDLHTAEKLKYFLLDCTYCSLGSNFMQKFPQIEHLDLSYFEGIERIDISSQSLKHFELQRIASRGPEVRFELQVDAPSLVSFVLNLHTPYFPDLSFANTSSECLSKISMFEADLKDTYQIDKMKQFLTKLIQSKKISLDLCFRYNWHVAEDITIDIPICRAIHVEDVNLWFPEITELPRTNIPEVLLLTYHPKVLRIQQGPKPLYPPLDENFREERCCPLMIRPCHDATNYCYKDLKEVRFEICDETISERRPGDWMNILEAPLCEEEGVCVRLDWKY